MLTIISFGSSSLFLNSNTEDLLGDGGGFVDTKLFLKVLALFFSVFKPVLYKSLTLFESLKL